MRDAFAEPLARKAISPNLPLAQCLAELALATNTPSHRAFALDALFAVAETDSDFARLREVTGQVNVFGFQVEPGTTL